ncbi:abhydrolase domain-containing protein 2 [Cimex lectularius]|uniref:AB hydrolase-1 domain-containing protein n=1 Tax=Cimex lectularius TaxID=79782 RepID=A0A8I6SD52_CIMLE|nr:abhydrolase domain-containing protein 2 [Cimex lectularius]XP_014261311.1 abhydrolase domain-containing protein 2 [Cimex lectularius]
MSAALVAIVAVFLWFVFKVLNINSQSQKPRVYCNDTDFLAVLVKMVPNLDESYFPTRLWGYNGHIQTIVHSIIGRVKCPWPIGERCVLVLSDGSTLTFDLYQPIVKAKCDLTIVVVPGICNTSESVYIRTFVHYAQCHGFRCAVLNHLGALSSVPLTAPRIFSYGHTGDLYEMVEHISKRFPSSKIVCLGYSMGGNLVTKYLGETIHPKPKNIVGAVSICQGYDIVRGTFWLLQWQNFRRFYLYAITEAMKNIILRHRSTLLSENAKQEYGLAEKEIIAAATLPELDDAYTRKVHGFTNLSELYEWSSSINYLKNINVPIVFVNSLDDPLIPDVLLDPLKEHASTNEKTAYVELLHGGHLGFYEGGFLYPNTVTWLDRTLIDMVAMFDSLPMLKLPHKSSHASEINF